MNEIKIYGLDFFAASTDHLVTLLVGIIPVMHQLNFPDPQTGSIVFCKLRGYIFQISLMLSRWFIAFACVDRYASSSEEVRLRNLAQPRIAYRAIVVIIVFWSIICSHRLIFYDIQGTLCGILNNTGAAIYHSAYVIIGGGVLPTIIMIIGAILVRKNLIHKAESHVRKRSERRTFSDQQILRLLSIQIVSYVIFTMPQLINLTFNAVSNTIPNRSIERLKIESFVFFMAELMLYLFPVTTFYMYTLTSRTFRKELIKIIRSLPILKRYVRKHVSPITLQSTVAHHLDRSNTHFNATMHLHSHQNALPVTK